MSLNPLPPLLHTHTHMHTRMHSDMSYHYYHGGGRVVVVKIKLVLNVLVVFFPQTGWEMKQMKDGRIFFVDHSK